MFLKHHPQKVVLRLAFYLHVSNKPNINQGSQILGAKYTQYLLGKGKIGLVFGRRKFLGNLSGFFPKRTFHGHLEKKKAKIIFSLDLIP